MPRLVRERDSAGDSGPMSQAIFRDEGGAIVIEENARPRVGVHMRVGSYHARSYGDQDWWITTPVTEIISEDENHVRFNTRSGSIYDWWSE